MLCRKRIKSTIFHFLLFMFSVVVVYLIHHFVLMWMIMMATTADIASQPASESVALVSHSVGEVGCAVSFTRGESWSRSVGRSQLTCTRSTTAKSIK